jgi:small subunit ribosomal protein S6
MTNYELTIVLPGKTTPAKKKAVVSRIEKLITTLKGKIGKLEDWGEKELSYKIKKNTTGVFLHFPIELDANIAKSLPAKLNVEEDIIRYLLVRK